MEVFCFIANIVLISSFEDVFKVGKYLSSKCVQKFKNDVTPHYKAKFDRISINLNIFLLFQCVVLSILVVMSADSEGAANIDEILASDGSVLHREARHASPQQQCC